MVITAAAAAVAVYCCCTARRRPGLFKREKMVIGPPSAALTPRIIPGNRSPAAFLRGRGSPSKRKKVNAEGGESIYSIN